jgi:hypothetical protein
MHGSDEFLGNLYLLKAEEEPELPDEPPSEDFPDFRKNFGPSGVLHSWASGAGTKPIAVSRMITMYRSLGPGGHHHHHLLGMVARPPLRHGAGPAPLGAVPGDIPGLCVPPEGAQLLAPGRLGEQKSRGPVAAPEALDTRAMAPVHPVAAAGRRRAWPRASTPPPVTWDSVVWFLPPVSRSSDRV